MAGTGGGVEKGENLGAHGRNLWDDLKRFVRPVAYLSHNSISRVGVGLTTTAAITLIIAYASQIVGYSFNPYAGILIFLILPGVFVLGLLLIPIGVYREFRRQRRLGILPSEYPLLSFSREDFQRTALFVAVMTSINVPLFALASYRGVVYMDSVKFCGTTCHTVMLPEYVAYERSPHARVPCVDCHIGPGAPWFVRSKLSGSYQVLATVFDLYPRPIPTPIKSLRPARETCEQCHWPEKFSGDKLLVRKTFADDEKNSAAETVLLMHIGGLSPALEYVGIHGWHLGLVTYIATDEKRQVIPWVSHRNRDGSVTEFVTTDHPPKPEVLARGERRLMDCIDCHNQPSHSYHLPEEAVDQETAAGRISPSLPYVHKVSIDVLKRKYPSRLEAETEIPENLREYYRKNFFTVYNSQRSEIEQAAKALVYIYDGNVFPAMNVTWGTYPNNLGHMDFPGCFRCHDGNHQSQGGQVITQDCNTCHSLLAMDEPHPKILQELQGGQ
jgi:nitrate/TMAO reductase-like tetraheme cytochrome c subunit